MQKWRSLVFIGFILIAGGLFAESSNAVPTIAVIDFEPKGKVGPDAADFVTERVRIELFKTGKYRIVERGQMQKILEEQKMELSGLSGNDYAMKVGAVLSAKKILLGTVSQLDDYYFINARIINVESGVMEYGDTVEVPSKASLSESSKSLVYKITKINTPSDAKQPQMDTIPVSDPKEDLGLFINSTINYFLEKVNIAVDATVKAVDQNIKNSTISSNSGAMSSASASSKAPEPAIEGQEAQVNSSVSDDEYLDNYVGDVKKRRDAYRNRKVEHSQSAASSVPSSVSREEASSQSVTESQSVSEIRKPPIPVYKFVIAESVGVCVPGFGLAHFILGDSSGGWRSVGLTALALTTFCGAQYGIKNGYINDANVYGTMLYGSLGIFVASYLADIAGAPVYYFNHESGFTMMPAIELNQYAVNKTEVNFNAHIQFDF